MKKNLKFLRMMATLDEAELSRFGKYLRREYPKEGNALKVYNYYQRFFPGKENPAKMDTAYAYRKIYGQELESELTEGKKIWNPLSKLSHWLKDFLLIEKLRSDEFTSDVLWMKILLEKGLNAEYAKEANTAYEKDYGLPFDLDACQQQIELAKHFRQQLYLDQPNPDYSALEPCLLKIKESADFISLQLECELLTKKGARPAKDPALQELAPLPPLHQIYKEIHLLLTTGEETHFNTVETMLSHHYSQISASRANDILRYLQYHTARMIRGKDGDRWAFKANDLNKVLIDKEIYSPRYEMRPDYFHNTVNTAAMAEDYEWANRFVAEYARFLPRKSREYNVRLALAAVAFGQKDFAKVLALTESLRFRDEIHRLRINFLRLRSMFELGMDPTDLLNTYRTYLIRRRHPYAAYKEAAIDSLKIFNMLIQRKESRKSFLEAIESNPQIFMRPWLIEKAATYRPVVYRKRDS